MKEIMKEELYSWCIKRNKQNLIEEWDYDKNNGDKLFINSISFCSTKKVYWKCSKCNNFWKSSIRQRTLSSRGCPYCAHLKPIIGENDLKTLYPELLKDWDYSKNSRKPENFTAYSGVKVWWKCHYCGHEWESTIRNRTASKRNCPYCTMKTTSFGEQAVFYYIKRIFSDAINRYRNFGIELDVYIPSIKMGIEFDGFHWHHTPSSMKREQKKYKICQDNKIKLIRIKDSKAKESYNCCDKTFAIENLKDNNQLEIIIRLLLQYLDPSSNFLTKKRYRKWSTIDSEINIETDRFKILENKYIRDSENSFANLYPNILKDWNYEKNHSFNPRAFSKASTIKVWWKCHKCNQEWQAKIVDRTCGNNKCPVCTNKILREGVNDFATLYPEFLEEWDYSKNEIPPNKILKKHNTKVYWKCKKCGFGWIASMGDRTRKDKPSGCPHCKKINASVSKHLKALKRGSISVTHPDCLNEWDYSKNVVSPNEVSYGANIKVWWKCKCCNYSWQSLLSNRLKRNSKCPKCKYK